MPGFARLAFLMCLTVGVGAAFLAPQPAWAQAQQTPAHTVNRVPANGTGPAATNPLANALAGKPIPGTVEGAANADLTQSQLREQAGLLVQDLKKSVDALTGLIRTADSRHDEAEFYRLSQCQFQQTLLLMVAGEAYNQLYQLPPTLLTTHPPTPEQLANDRFLGDGRGPGAERNFGQALGYTKVIVDTTAMARALGPTCTGRLPEVHILGLP